ncbi:MAG: phosphoadenosine phosphosulfate reductase, partial [Paraglaciecola sp.]
YEHAEEVIKKLNLNIHLYVPKQTVAHRNAVLGIPSIKDSKHVLFTEQVKLEPFTRALKEHKPDVWFTNLRKGQTAFRNSIDIVSKSKDGILKVSPFYNWSDEELDSYLEKHNLPNEFDYFDPTKVESTRECGLHI